MTNHWIPAFAGMTDTYTQSSFPRRRESIATTYTYREVTFIRFILFMRFVWFVWFICIGKTNNMREKAKAQKDKEYQSACLFNIKITD